MSYRQPTLRALAKAGMVCLTLAFGLGALTACDSLLEVDLPSQLTDDAVNDPDAAETLVNSVIAMFECAYSSLALQAMGHEDVWERIQGMAAPSTYATSPSTGECDQIEQDAGWYQNTQTARAVGEQTYSKMDTLWTTAEVPDRVRFQAILAIYVAASHSVLGEFFCEMAVNGGPLMSPDATLTLGEQWIQNALGHIGTIGDFGMPHDIASSAQTMAYALRARMLWARGETTLALVDAERVPMNFTALVTRDVGIQRRNKLSVAAFRLPFGKMLRVNDWWSTPGGDARAQGITAVNPATGLPWPAPIPYTGYLNLGLMPDGRAILDSGIPIRTSKFDAGAVAVGDAGAVGDTRVEHVFKEGSAGQPGDAPSKYTEEDDPIPMVGWREMWLIRAEIEGGQTAIDLVNDLRDHHGLPRVTYADPANADQIRDMVFEEKRRELWLEGGRWWSTKIRNTDLFWFPRDQGVFPTREFALEGGVRMIMPESEYDNNTNFTRANQATLCDLAERPIGF